MTTLKNIYTNREEILEVSKKLDNFHYIGSSKGNSYYRLDGKFYMVWQSGTGTFPEEIDKLPEDFQKK